MRPFKKRSFPLNKIRRFLEPGPVILISSAYKSERNVMTCGWHMMLDYEQIGCFIWDQNESREMIRRSRECVINVPTIDLIDAVIGIGNRHGTSPDKFDAFGITSLPATKVKVPMIAECYANFECKLIDTRLINRYSLFVFQAVKVHVATTPKYPTTVHYRGDGVFMMAGESKSWRKRFKPDNL